MFQYEYERISAYMDGFGFLNGMKYETSRHREAITRRAKEGWRYVGFIPVQQRGTGHIEEMDLVFEKEEESV